MKTIDKILTATYDLFSEVGYEQTSMSKVADQVGISKPALYHHFKSKDQMFIVLLEWIISQIKIETLPKIYSFDAYKDYIIEIGLDDIEYQLCHPKFVQIVKQYFLLSLRNETVKSLMDIFVEKTEYKYLRVIEYGVELGYVEETDKEILSTLLIMMDQSITDRIIGSHKDDYKLLWTSFVEKII